MNNLIGPISLDANCEDDKSVALLSDIDALLLDSEILFQNTNEIQEENEILETIVFDPIFTEEELVFVENASVSRASSVVCRKLLPLIDCSDCKCKMQTSTILSETDQSLDIIRPSQQFQNQFKRVFCGVNQAIPDLCSEKSVMKKVLASVDKIEVTEIGCRDHNEELTMKLKQCTINYALIKFCNNVNNLLSGKISILPPNYNDIEKEAFIFRLKRKKGKYSDIFEQ